MVAEPDAPPLAEVIASPASAEPLMFMIMLDPTMYAQFTPSGELYALTLLPARVILR